MSNRRTKAVRGDRNGNIFTRTISNMATSGKRTMSKIRINAPMTMSSSTSLVPLKAFGVARCYSYDVYYNP